MAKSMKFWIWKMRNCNIYTAKSKALISQAVTAQVIGVFVFANAKIWFPHDGAYFITALASFLNLLAESERFFCLSLVPWELCRMSLKLGLFVSFNISTAPVRSTTGIVLSKTHFSSQNLSYHMRLMLFLVFCLMITPYKHFTGNFKVMMMLWQYWSI